MNCGLARKTDFTQTKNSGGVDAAGRPIALQSPEHGGSSETKRVRSMHDLGVQRFVVPLAYSFRPDTTRSSRGGHSPLTLPAH
jgi:hypothetical protein